MVTIDPNNLIFSLISVLLGKVVTSDQYDVSNPIAKLGKYNTEVILTPKIIGPYYVKHSLKYNRIDIAKHSPIHVNRRNAVNTSDLLPSVNSLFDLSSHVTVSHLNKTVNFTIPPLRPVDIIDTVLPPLNQNSIYLLLNPNSYLFIGTALLYTFKAPIFVDFEVTEKRILAPIFFNFEVTQKIVVTATPTVTTTPVVTSTPTATSRPNDQCPVEGIQYTGHDFKTNTDVLFNDRQAAIDFSFSSYNSSDSHFGSSPARLNPNPTIEGTRVYYQMEIYYETYYGFQWRFFDNLELTPATRTCVPTATFTPTVTPSPTPTALSTNYICAGGNCPGWGVTPEAALAYCNAYFYPTGNQSCRIEYSPDNSFVTVLTAGDGPIWQAIVKNFVVTPTPTITVTPPPTQTATPTATVTPTPT